MRNSLTMVVALSVGSCATTSLYAPTSTSTARVRLVAQGAGNAYFAVPLQLKCSSKFGNPLDDGDQLLAVVHGQTTAAPKFGSQRVMGMPGAEAHPAWTYIELSMDAARETKVRTTFVLAAGAGPYDVSMCNSLSSVRFEQGKDYEVVFSAQRGSCSVRYFELRGVNAGPVSRTPVQPVSAQTGCAR